MKNIFSFPLHSFLSMWWIENSNPLTFYLYPIKADCATTRGYTPLALNLVMQGKKYFFVSSALLSMWWMSDWSPLTLHLFNIKADCAIDRGYKPLALNLVMQDDKYCFFTATFFFAHVTNRTFKPLDLLFISYKGWLRHQ